MGDITLSKLVEFAILAGAAYLSVRVGLANVTTTLSFLVTQVTKLSEIVTANKDAHAAEIGKLREQDARQQTEIDELKRRTNDLERKLSGSYKLP